MQLHVPEEFRCCICLSAVQDMLTTSCPHRLCVSCAEAGGLGHCPVCRATLPVDRTPDAAFASRARETRLTCECGAEVPLLEASSHTCEQLRKRKLPEVGPWFGTGRRRPPPAQNRSTFTCPICEEGNLTRQGLLEHCSKMHANCGQVSAICPICRAMPWGDPNYVSRDFLSHLQLRHNCDYAVLADFEADEETMLRRALQASLKDLHASEEDALARALEASTRDAEESSAASSRDGTDRSRSRERRGSAGSTTEESMDAYGHDTSSSGGETGPTTPRLEAEIAT